MSRIKIESEDLERAREPLERGWTLPPAAYTDPEIFQIEQEAIFARDWICVARTEQLPEIGDFISVDLPGQPVVVVRDREGTLRALSRICLHRAMPVAEGSGNATRFLCPYHHWTYELDGRLRSAPMMDGAEGFEPAECRLPALALEVWNGFVFINQDSGADPLAPQLEKLNGMIENYGFRDLIIAATTEYDSPWNWKILVENFMEAYHHIGPHRTTFEPIYPARASSVEDNAGAPWTFLRMPAKPGVPHGLGEPLPGLTEAERDQLLAMNVYPTLLFAASADGGVWYQLEPRDHQTMDLKIHYLLPTAIAESLTESQRTEIIERLRFIHDEDVSVNVGPWQGLQARLTTQGRLSPFEAAIWQLNQLWLERMQSRLTS